MKMTAVPLTIWSARRWIANTACTSASAPPAIIAITRPPNHHPVTSAPQMPKNAPISIIPSRPMFTTPLRSETSPPIAANVSGVVQTSASEMIVDHVMTSSRCEELAWAAATPPTIPTSPGDDGPPTRRGSRRA